MVDTSSYRYQTYWLQEVMMVYTYIHTFTHTHTHPHPHTHTHTHTHSYNGAMIWYTRLPVQDVHMVTALPY